MYVWNGENKFMFIREACVLSILAAVSCLYLMAVDAQLPAMNTSRMHRGENVSSIVCVTQITIQN